MEDAKLQKLYDTLNKLRPKGHSGLGSFSGGVKKADDGLPKNGLYAYFVREGHGGYKKWDDNEAEEEEPEVEEKQKKEKKKEKKLKKKQLEEEQAGGADEAGQKDKKKSKKRKRDEDEDEAAAEEDEGAENAVAAPGNVSDGSFNWARVIKKVVKQADNRQLPVKQLQKAVVVQAMEVYQDAMKKKHLKKMFKQQVTTVRSIVVEGGVASYSKGQRPQEIQVVEEDSETVVEDIEEQQQEGGAPQLEDDDKPARREKKRQKRAKEIPIESVQEEQQEEEGKQDKKERKKKSKKASS